MSSTPVPSPPRGGLYAPRLWRNPDTLPFIALVTAVVLLAGGGILLGQPTWGLALALCVGIAGVAARQVLHHRWVLFHLEHQQRNQQALDALHRLLPLKAPLPPMTSWACTPELAAVVAEAVLTGRPRRVLEVGSGVSSVVMGYCLESNGSGKLLSLDHGDAFADQTREQLARHGLSQVAEVVYAPLGPVQVNGEQWAWYDTAAVGEEPIDLLVVDGPPEKSRPEARYPAVPLMWDRLSDRAVVILDDARRSDEQAIVARWRREHPELHLEWVDAIKGIAILHRGPRVRVEAEVSPSQPPEGGSPVSSSG